MLMSSTTADWPPCELEPGDEALVLALDGLTVDHEAEPLFEVQRSEIALPSLFFQRLGHAGEPKRDKPFVCGMGQHFLSFRQW
jgi:hypothetical protein